MCENWVLKNTYCLHFCTFAGHLYWRNIFFVGTSRGCASSCPPGQDHTGTVRVRRICVSHVCEPWFWDGWRNGIFFFVDVAKMCLFYLSWHFRRARRCTDCSQCHQSAWWSQETTTVHILYVRRCLPDSASHFHSSSRIRGVCALSNWINIFLRGFVLRLDSTRSC